MITEKHGPDRSGLLLKSLAAASLLLLMTPARAQTPAAVDLTAAYISATGEQLGQPSDLSSGSLSNSYGSTCAFGATEASVYLEFTDTIRLQSFYIQAKTENGNFVTVSATDSTTNLDILCAGPLSLDGFYTCPVQTNVIKISKDCYFTNEDDLEIQALYLFEFMEISSLILSMEDASGEWSYDQTLYATGLTPYVFGYETSGFVDYLDISLITPMPISAVYMVPAESTESCTYEYAVDETTILHDAMASYTGGPAYFDG